jgi:hypothetical protein
MTEKVRVPRRVNRAIKLFATFTVKDLARMAIPLALYYFVFRPSTLSLENIAVAGGAMVVSGVWVAVRPYDQYLDQLALHAARFTVKWKVLPLARKLPVLDDDGAETELDSVELGYVTAEDGAVISLFEVSPTSLDAMSSAEQGVVHSRFQELYNTISFPIYLYSRQEQLDLSDYADYIEKQDADNQRLKQDYTEYLDGLSGGDLTATRHYIAVRVEKDEKDQIGELLPDRVIEVVLSIEAGDDELSNETQIKELENRCRTVRRSLGSSIDLKGVAGVKLEELAEEFSVADPNPGVTETTRPSEDGADEYRKTAYIHEFKTDQDLGWPLDLLRQYGKVDVVQRVEPRESAQAKKDLERVKEKMSAEIMSFQSGGRMGTHTLETVEEDTDWMLNLLADGEDKIVDYSVTTSAHSEDKESCDRLFNDICERLETKQVDYRIPAFRTDHIRKNDSPLHGTRLESDIPMPSGSAAAGFPFATQEAAGQGVLHGVDADDESPVLFDRFSWDAGHMVRMGKTGGGKSYAQKIELLRTVLAYPELNIFIVDPKNEREYAALIERLGGTIQTLESKAEYSFDDQYICFDLGVGDQDDIAAAMTNAVRQCHEATTELDEPTLVVIDEAHNMTDTDSGIRALSKFVREARSTETAITLLTQNASDLTHQRQGRTILDNTPAKIFMQHERVPDDVVDYFRLSENEREEINDLETGDKGYSEAIVNVSERLDTKIQIEATDEEHRVIEQLEAEQEAA